jgi:hypothetical protein
LTIAAWMSIAVATSLHRTNEFSALTVPLPPVKSPLTPQQLAEVRADPDAPFRFWRHGVELFADALSLAGIGLFLAGMAKYPRRTKSAKILS